MTIRHLTIFSEVCHLNSITKAAERLNMSQPAVSSAIRELETYYQTKLFERMNRRLYLTEPGQYLLQHADSVLAQLDEAKEYLSDIASATQIRIGSNVSFGESHLADGLPERIPGHPGLHHDTEFGPCRGSSAAQPARFCHRGRSVGLLLLSSAFSPVRGNGGRVQSGL